MARRCLAPAGKTEHSGHGLRSHWTTAAVFAPVSHPLGWVRRGPGPWGRAHVPRPYAGAPGPRGLA